MDQEGKAAEPLTSTRRTIARRMTEAWKIPVFHITASVATECAEKRRQRVTGATLTDELVRATGAALARYPALNAHFVEGGIVHNDVANVGIAVSVPAGLVVPVIADIGRMDLPAIAKQRRNLVQRARERKLTAEDMQGGTFTISNLGMYDIDRFDAILNPPQVAILAVGSTRSRLQKNGTEIVERKYIELTLTVDHRAVDGSMAASFLGDLRREVESPI